MTPSTRKKTAVSHGIDFPHIVFANIARIKPKQRYSKILADANAAFGLGSMPNVNAIGTDVMAMAKLPTTKVARAKHTTRKGEIAMKKSAKKKCPML